MIKLFSCRHNPNKAGLLLSTPYLLAALFTAASALLSAPTAQALSPSQRSLFDQGIYYFNEQASSCTTGIPVNTGDSPVAGLSNQQLAFAEKYASMAQDLSVQYGLPWETVVAQGILESAAGTSNFARERNNFFGIGAFDSNPDSAFSYPTPEAGWIGYYENIRNTATYRNHGVFQEPNITDPLAYLNAIKAAGYATDPIYIAKVSAFVKSIQGLAAQNSWPSSAELAQQHPEMLSNAAKNAAGAGASAVAAGAADGGSDSCMNYSSATLSGGIVDIANQMGAWAGQYQACYTWGGGHGSLDDLKTRIDNHFSGNYGVDCSGFVRAVIYKATSKDIGGLGTGPLCTSTLFEHIPKDQAQPGDLAIGCDSHVEVIVAVNSDGTFNTIGSHDTGCGAGYGASPGHYQGTQDYVLRYKGGF